MRFLLLALALVTAPALSAPPCTVPGLPFKPDSRQSYHLARGKLIDAGFRPVAHQFPADFTPADEFRALGYIEARDIANQSTLYGWTSPRGLVFTLYETHLGKIGIEQCGLAPAE